MHPGDDWQQTLDLYCERTTAGFWAEPVNALTNAAFLVAALLLARELRRLQRSMPVPPARLPAIATVAPLAAAAPLAAPVAARWSSSSWSPLSLWLLVALLASIGVGSFLFHTFATRWASAADVLPIYLFMHAYAACFLRWAIGWRWSLAWLGAPAFLLLARAVALTVPPATFGMGGYLPALLALAAFAGWLALRDDARWKPVAAAAVLFMLSLTLRQSDLSLCAYWPLGTHWLWHLLNAVVLYLVTRTLLPARSQRDL